MNFCSNCGSDALEFRIPDGDNLPRFCCEKCGTILYQNPRVVVGAIPVWDGKIMLARRGISPRKGFWNLPCGFLELNETVEEGALREVLEETGARVNLTGLHTIYNLPDAHQLYIIFTANMASDYFTATSESTEIQLFKVENIPWDEIAFSSNSFALKNYINDLEQGFKHVHIGTFKKSKSDHY